MGSFGPGYFMRCLYCEYHEENPYLIDGESGPYALCPWCWDYLLIAGGTPNGPWHWWATWRWQHERRKAHMSRMFPNFTAPIIDNICDFLDGPQP